MSIINVNGETELGCIHGKESLLISPIIDWTENDVWTFLNTLGISHCELYDEGDTRIGCICCPLSTTRQKWEDAKRWPHVKRGWLRVIRQMRVNAKDMPDWVVNKEMSAKWYVRPQMMKTDTLWLDPNINEYDSDEEREQTICENILDWWFSGKNYKQWFVRKFLSPEFDFNKNDEDNSHMGNA